ncbi:MAG: cupin domain-containing protein [Actinobacteria bacterium]|nr:cupin domain-containing protein [Actinomycetota bacterium]
MSRSWMFLGVAVDILTDPTAPISVAELELPEGASPPLHVHADLDDSFYVLEGRMVIRCGNDVTLAEAGSWVQFPSRVPHTFRVLDGPARVLATHANDSFMSLVTDVGSPRGDGDHPTTGEGPPRAELDRVLAGHGIVNVGAPMEEGEARELLGTLTTA